MTDQNENELEANAARLAAEVEESKAHNKGKRGGAGKPNAAVAAGLFIFCGLLIAFMFWPEADPDAEAPMPTGQPEQFQTSNDAPFGNLSLPQRRQPEPAEPDPALLAQIEALQAELNRLRDAPQEGGSVEVQAPTNNPQIDALLAQVAALQESMNTMQLENAGNLSEAQRRADLLQTQLDAARIQGGSADLGANGGAVERRLEAEELYRARAASPMVAFGNSGGGDGSGGADAMSGMPGMEGMDPNERRQSQNERFARQQATRASTQQAQIIANPANTVMQGTMIQAVLETAINTDLPGAIRALVSEDVHSFDGSRILIPRGSRVIGVYNDQTDLGQRRAMIVWNRIIMPDNQTVEIGAYGGDAIGRSGVDGKVNTHFGARFGSAALISMIGLAPTIALSDEDDDSNTSDIADAMSQTMTSAMQGTLGAYLNRKPTIAIDQGSLVTIMVDRDLEIF